MLAMAKAHVLVVDDDKSIVKVVRSYLEQAGYEVSTALDGEHALHLLRSERPDLMVLDLMLPDRDGWEITRIVRNDQSLGGMPIIMLTARVEDTDKVLGLELGADDYVTKPFNAREIAATRAGLVAPRSRLSAGLRHHRSCMSVVLRLDPDRHSLDRGRRAHRTDPAPSFTLLRC